MIVQKKRSSFLLGTLMVVLICLAAVPAVSAFTSTLTAPADPTKSLVEGQTISVQIDGLAAGNNFKYQITGSNLDVLGSTVALTGVNMPFGFNDGTATTSLSTTGLTGNAALTVKRLSDGTEVTLNGNPITSSKNVRADNYDVSITGARTGGSMGIDYSVTGTVAAGAPASSTLSFSLKNVKSGTINVYVYEGSTVRLSQTMKVATNEPIPTPTPDSGGGGQQQQQQQQQQAPKQEQKQQQAPIQEQVKENEVVATLTGKTNEEGQTLTTIVVDAKAPEKTEQNAAQLEATPAEAVLTVEQGTKITDINGKADVKELSIAPVAVDPKVENIATVAGGAVFSVGGTAVGVECGPAGTQFSEPVTVGITMTDAQWSAFLEQTMGNKDAASISASSVNKDGKEVTETLAVSRIDEKTHTVYFETTHFSVFVLILKNVEKPSPQTFGQMIQATPTPVTTAAAPSAPVTTPGAKTQMAPTSTTKTPLTPGLALIAVVGFAGFCLFRKQE